jgi:sugar transferase (PEP-CTERM system associated)
MTRLPGREVSFEMAMLGLVEFALSFLVIYGMLVLSGMVPTGAGLPGAAAHMAAPDAVNLAAMLSVAVILAAAAIGLYRPEICIERRRLPINAGAAGILAFPAVLVVTGRFNIEASRQVLLLSEILVGWLVCIVASRRIFNRVMRERWFIRRVLVIGSASGIARMQRLVSGGRERLFEQVAGDGLGQDSGSPALSPDALQRHRIWGIVVAADAAETMPLPFTALVDCKLRGIPVFDEAVFSEQHLGRIDLGVVKPEWLVFADGFVASRLGSAAKRLVDVCVSLCLLLLTLPLVLLIALLVRIDSPGPVLYRQERVGLYGRMFTLLKFRSMRVDAEKAGGPLWASRRDPRITRVGGFIRRLRIDELPQLFNILLGQMSMIGPRPERPHFVERLADAIPHYRERHYVKPGLTGWAQVNYPYGASIEDARHKLSYDLYYVKNRAPLLDMLILLATIRVILFGEGAR